jgi:hypothetical protein
MIMHERKVILKEVDRLDIDGLTLSAAIKELDRLSGIHGTGATIDLQNYQYDEGQYWAVFKYVPETDEQMNARIALIQRDNRMQEAREKRQLAELIAKHGVPDAK